MAANKQSPTKLMRQHLGRILDSSRSARATLLTKLDAIDEAYARFKEAQGKNDQDGIDRHGSQPCGNALTEDVVNPVVISQVDSMVAFLSEVFLSGYPIFPVVSGPADKDKAEALEGIMQDHLILTESIPEMLMNLRDAVKYNLTAAELPWQPIQTYNPTRDLADMSGAASSTNGAEVRHVNAVKRINIRNLHWDTRVPYTSVDRRGEFIGYSELINRIELVALINRLKREGTLNHPAVREQALCAEFDHNDYQEDPVLSRYVSRHNRTQNWDIYGGWAAWEREGFSKAGNSAGCYVLHTFYVRIVPEEFGFRGVPNKDEVHIYKVRMVGRNVILSMEPYTGSQGRFGIITAQAIEDGLDLQSQSYGEMAEPVQRATTRMFNIRFQAAKRAVADRAIFNPELLRPSDVNNPSPSAKIPLQATKNLENPMQSAYYSIPFDPRGTESVLQDAMLINEFAKELSGMNSATRGQFTRGNRTLGEFDSIMGSSENRMRLPALTLEYRYMAKIREQFKLNLLQFGDSTTVISPRSKKPLEVSMDELQQAQMSFEVGDGYTPKSRMANTEFLMSLTTLIMNSPNLQAQFGARLPGLIAHIAQLGGVRGFAEYAEASLPEYQLMVELQQQIQQIMAQLQMQPAGQAQTIEGEVVQ